MNFNPDAMDSNMNTLEPSIKDRVLASFGRQRLMQLYGAEITGIDRGFLEITLLSQDFLLRTSGIFHGGVLAALADSAAGYAATTLHLQDASFLTVEFKINFLNQANGDKLIARARVLKGGKTLTVSQTDLFTQNQGSERLVATALVTLMKAH